MIWALARSYKVNGVKYRDARFTINVVLGNADLAFAVQFDSELVAACEAQYPDT